METQLAMVAIQLGMVDEAKSLYENSGRHDMFSKICQSNAEIEKSRSSYTTIIFRTTSSTTSPKRN